MSKLTALISTTACSLIFCSQLISTPAKASPLNIPSPKSSLLAYTNTSSLVNLIAEFRKSKAELQRLESTAKQATAVFNRLNAELDRVAVATKSASPELKATLAVRFDQLVVEMKQWKTKMDIALGQKEQTEKRLAMINSERNNLRVSLQKDLDTLNTEANIIRKSLKELGN